MTLYLTALPDDLFADPSDADEVHKVTMALYRTAQLPGKVGERRAGANILWRRQPGGVLVQAELAATDIPDGAETGVLGEQSIPAGTRVRFIVTVDAVRRVRGREVPTSDVDAWLEERVGHALYALHVDTTGVAHARRRGASFAQVTVLGQATVVCEDALRALVHCGVGRSKAFGCGLLTVVPA